MAEQNTNVALRFAQYGYILESGRVVMDGPAAELRENPDVKEFYLGMSDEGRRAFVTYAHTAAARDGCKRVEDVVMTYFDELETRSADERRR